MHYKHHTEKYGNWKIKELNRLALMIELSRRKNKQIQISGDYNDRLL